MPIWLTIVLIWLAADVVAVLAWHRLQSLSGPDPQNDIHGSETHDFDEHHRP